MHECAVLQRDKPVPGVHGGGANEARPPLSHASRSRCLGSGRPRVHVCEKDASTDRRSASSPPRPEASPAPPFAEVRELASLSSPWFHHAVDEADAAAYAASWETAFDSEGLGGAFGLRTAEARNPGYSPGGAGCCHWNGPMWPYETSKALRAAIDILQVRTVVRGGVCVCMCMRGGEGGTSLAGDASMPSSSHDRAPPSRSLSPRSHARGSGASSHSTPRCTSPALGSSKTGPARRRVRQAGRLPPVGSRRYCPFSQPTTPRSTRRGSSSADSERRGSRKRAIRTRLAGQMTLQR